MDDTRSLVALQRAREEVVFSTEWEELNRELLTQLQHLEYLQGEGQLKNYSSLSNQEKIEAVGKAARALEKTKAFDRFQAKVFHSIDHHFSSVSPRVVGPAGAVATHATSQTDIPVDDMVKACTQLLQDWPHLKHHLKKCLNHPLLPQLRTVAWKLILQNPSVRKHFLGKVHVTAHGGLFELTPEDRRVAHRCEALLNSSPIFADMADSIGILRAMRNAVLYWKLRSDRSIVSDRDLLLCIPFLYVRREELSQQREGIGQDNWSMIAEIVEQYVSFMEMLPLAMHSVVVDVSF